VRHVKNGFYARWHEHSRWVRTLRSALLLAQQDSVEGSISEAATGRVIWTAADGYIYWEPTPLTGEAR